MVALWQVYVFKNNEQYHQYDLLDNFFNEFVLWKLVWDQKNAATLCSGAVTMDFSLYLERNPGSGHTK